MCEASYKLVSTVEIMEHFKIVDETILEESLGKDETVENFICDACGHMSTSARNLHSTLYHVMTVKSV